MHGHSLFSTRVMAAFVLLCVMVSGLPTVLVYGAGYAEGGACTARGTSGTCTGTITIILVGAPALVGQLMTVVDSLSFSNGMPVKVPQTQVDLRLCSTTCTMVLATIAQITPGTYGFTFAIPTLTGLVNVILPAGSLTDQFGRAIPGIDTGIGSYTAPGGASPANYQPASPMQPWPGTFSEAVQASQPNGLLTAELVLGVVTVLSTLGVLILPRRK